MTDQPFAGISPLVQQYLSDTGNDIHIGRNDTFSLGYQAACATLSTMIWDVYKECDPPCGPSRRNQITGRHWCQPTADGSKRIKRHGIVDRLWHWSDEIIGIGTAGRNRMMPTAQSWQRTPTPPTPVRRGWFDRFLDLFGGSTR